MRFSSNLLCNDFSIFLASFTLLVFIVPSSFNSEGELVCKLASLRLTFLAEDCDISQILLSCVFSINLDIFIGQIATPGSTFA